MTIFKLKHWRGETSKGQLSGRLCLKSKDGQNLAHVQFRLDQYQKAFIHENFRSGIAGIEKIKLFPVERSFNRVRLKTCVWDQGRVVLKDITFRLDSSVILANMLKFIL